MRFAPSILRVLHFPTIFHMSALVYYVKTLLVVQFAFITLLLYCLPIMHGIWRGKLAVAALHVASLVLIFVGLPIVGIPLLACVWLYVTCVTMYFLDESHNLHTMGKYTNTFTTRTRSIPTTPMQAPLHF